MKSHGSDNGVIAKAALILNAFSTTTPRHGVSDLAAATGLTPSTAMRRADDLVRAGLLEKDERSQYTVAPRLHRIAAAAPSGKSLLEIARPVMQDVCFATTYDVSLTVRDGLQGLIVERLHGSHQLLLRYTVGEYLPLHATGSGLALLAHLSPDIQERVLELPLEAMTPYTETNPARLRRLLADVRRKGYVVSNAGSNVETLAIGAPVFGPGSTVVAGLSVVVDRKQAVKRALVDTARLGARILSTRLGWKPQRGVSQNEA